MSPSEVDEAIEDLNRKVSNLQRLVEIMADQCVMLSRHTLRILQNIKPNDRTDTEQNGPDPE